MNSTQNIMNELLKTKWYVTKDGQTHGYLKHIQTEKGPRWSLTMLDPVNPESDGAVTQYHDFDKAYAALGKKKPAGSYIEKIG